MCCVSKTPFPGRFSFWGGYWYVVSDISRFFQPVARKIFLSFILYKWPQHCNHLISVLLKRHFITFEKTFHPWVVLNRPCTYLTSVPACMLFSKESFFDVVLVIQDKKFCAPPLLRVNPGFGHSKLQIIDTKCDRTSSKSKNTFRTRMKTSKTQREASQRNTDGHGAVYISVAPELYEGI